MDGVAVNALCSPNNDSVVLHRMVLDAETRCAQWLADGNQAREAGKPAKAERCYAKSQYWLDRYNRLIGAA